MEHVSVDPDAQHEAGEFKGRPFKVDNKLDSLAEKVIALLRPEGLTVWQAKDVMKRAINLIDWETLK